MRLLRLGAHMHRTEVLTRFERAILVLVIRQLVHEVEKLVIFLNDTVIQELWLR